MATYLYFVKPVGRPEFKFGISEKPDTRLAGFRTMHPLGFEVVYLLHHTRAASIERTIQDFLRTRGALLFHEGTGRPSEMAETGDGNCHLLAALSVALEAGAQSHPTASYPLSAAASLAASQVEIPASRCPACEYVFGAPKALRRHEREGACRGAPPLVCPTCRKAFNTASAKSMHLKKGCAGPPPPPPEPTSATNITNNITNIDNSNHVTNNVTNNTYVFVNDFGRERFDHILRDPMRMDRYIRRGLGGVVLFVEDVYLDPAHPENRTVRILGSNNGLAKIRKRDGWGFIRAKTATDEVITSRVGDLEDHARSGDSLLIEATIENFKREAARVTGEITDPRRKEELARDIFALLIGTSDSR